MPFASAADARRYTDEMPWKARDLPVSVHALLARTAGSYAAAPAISYQLFSDPGAKAETLSWEELRAQVTQAANLFRSLGVGETDAVAFLLPNCNEAVVTLLAGATAGIVNPINPLLEPQQIASILRETGAKVLVTLKSFPKTDVAQKAAEAVAHAPNVKHVLEVDLLRYVTGLKKLIIPAIRPKNKATHNATVQEFRKAIATQNAGALDFTESDGDRVGAYFHTGGTTGMPKVAQHLHSGMIYNGWLGSELLFDDRDVVICPLPVFHVFAVYPILMSALSSGAHVVFPTPAGYRGEGTFDNFWKLVERWKVTFVVGVPTAFAALMQRPVDADLSTLKTAFSGSSPLPVELFRRFEKATGVTICEGYGLTEATCLVSINPVEGEKKIGSVGVPFPYTDVRILVHKGGEVTECETDVVGEICVANPGVFPGSTYTEAAKNKELFHYDRYLRTGDLGRLDADGYLWITGRAKDLIIRGGHNIDPAVIEEALSAHEEVALSGAIGQPDAHSGELPCAYVELVKGATVTEAELLDFARDRISERAAVPKYLEIMDELPKTAVGKIFKPELRKRAIARVYDAALSEAGVGAEVVEVVEDKKRGLVARLKVGDGAGAEDVQRALSAYTRPWELVEQ
ncbi:acyl-CoA synthetase [Roseicyclus sp. F158]|uniref:Acyl-CoA synthetase n=1 Tax=Tropicimonas omnivorans TaxID=3075590 RepID=A0ABU3DBL3_9RHOB|nr:acyl-CoA synthetase [Roseicyclus sp. F158]MDT0681109.1 acyl-CoA synthetase [Roseicyclus sp. F158]